MKIIRFIDESGAVGLGSQREDGQVVRLNGSLLGGYESTEQVVTVKKLLAPIEPTVVLGIGLNYRRHADEGGAAYPKWPVLFLKSPGALQNPGDPIELPTKLASEQVDYEAELAVVIGKTGKNIPREKALEYVLGYTCANDVSARDWQIQWGGSQWCRGKTFDTFLPLGPCIVTADEIPDPNTLQIKSTLAGQMMQDWNTNDMIFDVPALIEFLSGSTTLLAGTVILTGTPHGVGQAQKPPRFLRDGDTISVEIEKIGALTNPVRQEAA